MCSATRRREKRDGCGGGAGTVDGEMEWPDEEAWELVWKVKEGEFPIATAEGLWDDVLVVEVLHVHLSAYPFT